MRLRIITSLVLLSLWQPPCSSQEKEPERNRQRFYTASAKPIESLNDGTYRVKVILKIAPGAMINANPSGEQGLLPPTKLRLETKDGTPVAATIVYPKGTAHPAEFLESGEYFVYEKQVTIQAVFKTKTRPLVVKTFAQGHTKNY